MSSNSVVYWGTGRRKTSVARVRLVPGNGTITINGRPGDNYLNYNPSYIAAVKAPLETLGLGIGVRHPGERPRRRTHRSVRSDQARCRPCSL